MITGHCFKRLAHRRRTWEAGIRPDNGTFQAFLSDRVVEPFARLTSLKVLAVPVDIAGLQEDEDPPENPAHLACARFADSEYCRESWQLHLAELKHRPETHWHTCDYGRLCAVTPLVFRGRCVAVFRLACPSSTDVKLFQRNVELLDVLVEGVAASEAAFLARLGPVKQAMARAKAVPSHRADRSVEQRPRHPRVLKALEYIEDHLSDPKLAVRRIAFVLSIHPDYLAHLFARQVGRRMSRHITARRIERAKNLLAHTNWQVKRVARETGHANPNWFSYVFRVETGLAPSKYRQASRRQSLARLPCGDVCGAGV